MIQNLKKYYSQKIKKVVHIDIKPDNIYYSTKRNIPLLFDFDATSSRT